MRCGENYVRTSLCAGHQCQPMTVDTAVGEGRPLFNARHRIGPRLRHSGRRMAAITTTHKLLTDSWTADVETLEMAVGGFTANHALKNDCRIVFFEMIRDRHLHVNVTHKYRTKSAAGWAGPGSMPQGFVHNRNFSHEQARGQIVRHVRDMVFAGPVSGETGRNA